MSAPSSIEAAVKDRIVRDATLAEIQGTRVFPCVVPETEKYPATTYQRTATQRTGHMKGGAGIIGAMVEVRLWSRDYDQTKVMFAAIKNLWEGFKGNVAAGGTTFHVSSCFIGGAGESDDYAPSPHGDGTVVYACVVPLLIKYSESVPSYVS